MKERSDRTTWKRIEEIFDRADDLSPAKRAALLDEACGDDLALRAEVEELLAAGERSTGPLDDLPDTLTAPRLVQLARDREELESARLIGQRIGAFRLLREIGHGGMGTVYLAERADGQFEQRVALKLLKRGMDSDAVLRAFRRERQILAHLEHPHIARLLDGGLSPEGLPYFVMELVEGQAITAYCEAKELPIEERLRLFGTVCDAVQAAHDRQIVHRDLKPSNILVSDQGEVKLLDFGIAKLLAPESAVSTRTETFAMTPAYAAPEQLMGQPATAVTDVYTLGLLLHELLTGQRAHRGGAGGLGSLLRAVLDEPPERPSSAVGRGPASDGAGEGTQARRGELRRLRKRLRGDLDGIVLRALEKEPKRRYPSVALLAEDLRRHLAGLPVTARGGGLGYRAAKLLRRHRAAAAMAAVAAVAAALLVAALARQFHGKTPARPLRFQLLSTFGGSHHSPSFSHDGRNLAFIQTDDRGVPQVWVMDAARREPTQLTHGERPARHPRWSPKNDQIVYDVLDQGIWSAAVRGGAAHQLLRQGFNASLSRDGARLVYETEARLWTAGADGSGARPLTAESFQFSRRKPSFSPDGLRVVFFIDEVGPYGDLWVMPSAGGKARRITHDGALGGDPVWTPDGHWILYSSERMGAANLWRVPAEGGTPLPVTEGSGEDAEPDLAPDGRRLVYTSSRHTFALAWLDPRTGERRDLLARSTPVTHPSFSPRGDRVAFFAPLQGPYCQLYTVGLHGEDLRQITADPDGVNILPEWSADARFLYFYHRSFYTPRRQLFFGRLPATGGPVEKLLPGWRFDRQHGAQVDPAGRRVAYSSLRGVAAAATLVRDLASGHEAPLAQPILWPRWSPDGRSLAGQAADGRLVLCPGAGENCRTLAGRGSQPRWTLGGREIYFAHSSPATTMGAPAGTTLELRSVAPDGTGERHVADLPGIHPIHFFYAPSPSGEVVWCEWRPGRQELWEAELPN